MSAFQPPDPPVPVPAEDDPLAFDEDPDPATDGEGDQPDDQLDGEPDEEILAQYPPVVAVVVTRNPGPWLEDTLGGLAAQDYDDLTVLVVDCGSQEDPTPRVAAVLPRAFVRRLDESAGFAAAANEALHAVEGATFLLLCHDDVVLDPDAVRLMVEEGYRSNAGILGPKLVSADNHEILLEVGRAIDRFGAPYTGIEPGELDQEQHDGVRDVFYVTTAAMLVRTDLFEELGGFDPATFPGAEDLDLCWRARLAGARVLVAPDARASHREAADERALGDRPDEFALARSRVRVLFTSYSLRRLLWLVPFGFVVGFIEALGDLLTGHPRRARAAIGSWYSNLLHVRALQPSRRRAQQLRRVHDSELRELQVSSTTRLERVPRPAPADRHPAPRPSVTRRAVAVDSRVRRRAHAGRGRVPRVPRARRHRLPRHRHRRGPGHRHLRSLAGGRRPVRQLRVGVALHRARFRLVRLPPRSRSSARWAPCSWVRSGSRRPSPSCSRSRSAHSAPTGWRAASSTCAGPRSPPASPTASTRWPATRSRRAAWARWCCSRCCRSCCCASSASARGTTPARAGSCGWPSSRRCWGPGTRSASACSCSPPPTFVLAVPIAGAGRMALRGFGIAVVAAVGGHGAAVPVAARVRAHRRRQGRLRLRVPTRPRPLPDPPVRHRARPAAGWMMWGLVVAAAVPLFVATGDRLAWTARGWLLALVGWAVVWVPARFFPDTSVLPPEAGLTLAALGLALCLGIAVSVFVDGIHSFKFGWRQPAVILGAVAILLPALAFTGDVFDGRWDAPTSDWTSTLAFTQSLTTKGDFRMLWVGDPTVLPLDPVVLRDGTGYTLTRNGPGDVTEQWRAPEHDADHVVDRALDLATAGLTNRLGRMLAPMGVRYVVVPSTQGPGGGAATSVPRAVRTAMAQQLDFAQLQLERGSGALFEPGVRPHPCVGPRPRPDRLAAPQPGRARRRPGRRATDHVGTRPRRHRAVG